MTMDDKAMEKLLAQCRLTLTEDEKTLLAAELAQMMAALACMGDVALEELTPQPPMENRLREDVVQPSLDRARMLANAPRSNGEYWKAPKTVEQEG